MKTHCLEPDLLWAPASGSSSLSIFPNASSHDLSFLIVLSRPPMKFCSSCTIMKHRSRSSPDRPHDPTARCKRSCTETWLKVNPQQTVLRVISYDVSTNSFYKLITVRKNQEKFRMELQNDRLCKIHEKYSRLNKCRKIGPHFKCLWEVLRVLKKSLNVNLSRG